MIPPLLGVTDVAQELGWGKAKVSEYRRRGVLPEPATQIGGRPVWTKKQIEKFKREKGMVSVKKLIGDPNTQEWFLVKVDREVTNPDYEEIHGKWKPDGDRSGWFTDEDSGCRIRVIRDGGGEWRTSGMWED